MFCLLLLLSLLLLIFLSFIFVSLFLSSFVFCLHSPWFHSYLNRSNQHSINWIQINLTFTGSDKIIDATKKNILDEKKYFISTCFDHHCVVYSKDQIAIEWIFLLLLERRHWRFESTNLNISSIYFIIHFMLAKILLYQLICLTFVFIFFLSLYERHKHVRCNNIKQNQKSFLFSNHMQSLYLSCKMRGHNSILFV